MHFKDKQILTSVLAAAFREGYTVDVNDGEEVTLRGATGMAPIFAALETTDEDVLIFRTTGGRRVGVLNLIHGNEHGVIIADGTSSASMQPLWAAAERASKSLGF